MREVGEGDRQGASPAAAGAHRGHASSVNQRQAASGGSPASANGPVVRPLFHEPAVEPPKQSSMPFGTDAPERAGSRPAGRAFRSAGTGSSRAAGRPGQVQAPCTAVQVQQHALACQFGGPYQVARTPAISTGSMAIGSERRPILASIFAYVAEFRQYKARMQPIWSSGAEKSVDDAGRGDWAWPGSSTCCTAPLCAVGATSPVRIGQPWPGRVAAVFPAGARLPAL